MKTEVPGGLTKRRWKNHKLFTVYGRRSSNLLALLVKLNTSMLTILAVIRHN